VRIGIRFVGVIFTAVRAVGAGVRGRSRAWMINYSEHVYQHDMLPVSELEAEMLSACFTVYDRIIYRTMFDERFMMRDN